MGRITQFSVVTERGSEYNTVERENSRKMTANGGGVLLQYYRALGGLLQYYRALGGLLQYYRALGGGGKEDQANFI